MSNKNTEAFTAVKDETFTKPEVLEICQAVWAHRFFTTEETPALDHLDPEDVDRRFALSLKNWIADRYIQPMKAGNTPRAPHLYKLAHIYQVALLRFMHYHLEWSSKMAGGLVGDAIYSVLTREPSRRDGEFLCFIQRRAIREAHFHPICLDKETMAAEAGLSAAMVVIPMTMFDDIDQRCFEVHSKRSGE